ncbi:hypothetical protein [Streptococcus suis]|uniref:hypothetical protein n=1 Tax=Streptococcus suis TaxID=1307 RepID=UPI002FC5F407
MRNEKIEPLLISMFIDEPVQQQFSTEENRAFFTKYGPVGARSGATKAFLIGLVWIPIGQVV